MKRFRLWNYLSSSLWFVPILCVLAGVALSFGTIALDRTLGGSFIPRSLGGDPNAALAVLTTVAASMVTLTGLVLTITMVVVQLAMGQFTPRVLRTILRDRPSQLAIGVFVATFAHAMLVMREVKAPASGDQDGYVPGLAIVVAFVLILVSVMVLVGYVHHIGQSLRVASIIESVGEDTRKLLDKTYPQEPVDEPDDELPSGSPTRVIEARESGVLYRVGEEELVERATEADAVIALRVRVGDFVPAGAPLVDVYGGDGRLDDRKVMATFAFGKERTLDQDVAYGLRLLVDVAVRSLSSAMGDPTTALQALDRLHDCLRQLAIRPFPSGRHFDESGRLRLVLPTVSWDGYVQLALDELRHAAPASVQVTRRMRAMLDDLLEAAPGERRPPLERQVTLLERMVERSFDEGEERETALRPDAQGIGFGPDVAHADGRPEPVGEPSRARGGS